MATNPMVIMGRVASAHGIKGWIKVQPFTEYHDSLADFSTWWITPTDGGSWQEVKVLQCEVHHKTLAVLLPNCPDRNASEKLKGWLIGVPREQLPEQADDEYYWSDLIGVSVINEAGENLGLVEQLLETGANQVLMVQGASGQILIPFVASAIKLVDIKNKTIKVDWAADYLK
ncbi:MAG: ribosome maturation factor RimM [Gallionella sp.]